MRGPLREKTESGLFERRLAGSILVFSKTKLQDLAACVREFVCVHICARACVRVCVRVNVPVCVYSGVPYINAWIFVLNEFLTYY